MEKPFMQSCIAFIEEHLDQDVNVAVLAKEMGYSLFHFHRKFQQEFQMTATAYMKGRRLLAPPPYCFIQRNV
ncbi:AraC family transcriptional regulator [Bacillus sp. JCM 19041]|uniref:AraC family transcriptional regulator n=1 Tax=Bacillus sp. JCM 19041 TaxID=1460637 RepID=UPI000A469CD4